MIFLDSQIKLHSKPFASLMGKLTQGILRGKGVYEQGIQANVTHELKISLDSFDNKPGNNKIYLKPERA